MSTTFYNSQNLVGIGNVGIGITSPLSSLHVLGGITGTYGATFLRCANGSGGNFSASNVISIGYNGSKDFLNLHVPGNSGASDILPGITMLATSSGAVPNVGIGRVDPSNILTVGAGGRLRIANANNDYTLIGTNDTDGSTNSRIVISGNSRGTNNGGIEYVSVAAASGTQGDHKFYRAETTQIMTLSGTNGNLGVGRTDPPYKLSVDNGSTTGPVAFLQASSITNTQTLSLIIGKTNSNFNAGTILWNHQADGSATNYLGLGYWGGDNKLCITAAGAVGVGITNPTSYTFQVVGSIGTTADITAYYSDDRLKTRTGKLENALDKVCSLDTFTYVTNDLAKSFGFDDVCQRVGLSAQQVQKVLPEVVKRAPFDGEKIDGVERSKTGQNYLTVQYEKLVPLLVEALKEERSKRESLEARIAALELRPCV